MNFTDQNHFSIILPTFNEAKNIPELITRIAQIDFAARKFEVIIVDDNSQDGTKKIVATLQQQYHWLRIIIRQGKKGLSESVLEGLSQAIYATYVVMDADLSHPPEKIPDLLKTLEKSPAEFVIGSRYIAGGSSDRSWPWARKLFSRWAALLARMVLTIPVKDPLSGFWAVKKTTVSAGAPLQPIGWKIGLEIMVKCRCHMIYEVPIHFSQREHGSSKLNLYTILNYLQHIYYLFCFKLQTRNVT